MWFGVAAFVLFLSVLPLAGMQDRAHGQRRENIAVLIGVVVTAMVACAVGCVATQQP